MPEHVLVLDNKTYKLGLKLWSSNASHLEPALALYEEGIFDYVELLVVPGKGRDFLKQWKDVPFPVSLHAPHYAMGLNFSLKECEQKNRMLIEEVEAFREALGPLYVVFHPGVQGSLEETIRQIKIFKGEFPDLFNMVLLENKPKIGLKEEICVGASPEEIKKILDETGLGFCLDIGHAICYAAWKQMRYEDVVNQFLKLSPGIFHLTDGDAKSVKDQHGHFGEGNFDLLQVFTMIPDGARVTIETGKSSEVGLNDFRKDILYLRGLNRE